MPDKKLVKLENLASGKSIPYSQASLATEAACNRAAEALSDVKVLAMANKYRKAHSLKEVSFEEFWGRT
jgi:hypothetical protein